MANTSPIALPQLFRYWRALPHQSAAVVELEADLAANGYSVAMRRDRPWFATWSQDGKQAEIKAGLPLAMGFYGLRPHEIEGATLIGQDYCQVADGTKTGFRTVVPLPRDWVERFGLRDRRLRLRLEGSADRPEAVSKWLNKELRRQGLPWRPYSLRHAYGGRLWREGGSRLDIYTAARLMGHSPLQHSKTYRAHIQPFQIAEAAERALGGGA